MRIRMLKRFWVRFTKERARTSTAPFLADPWFIPITAGLRVDLSVPIGPEKETPASDFFWVFPAGPSRSVKTLRVRLFSN